MTLTYSCLRCFLIIFFFFNKISIVSGVLSLILQTQSNLSFLLLSAGSSEVLQQSLYFYN